MPLSILTLSKSLTTLNRIEEVLGLAGYVVDWQQVHDADELRASLAHQDGRRDVCLVTDELPELSPQEAVSWIRQQADDIPIVVIVEPANESAGLEAMRLGATELLYWDRLAHLGWAVNRILTLTRQRANVQPALVGGEEQRPGPVPAGHHEVAAAVLEMLTPISTLSLYTHLLAKGSPDRYSEYLHALEQQVEALTHLLRGALEKTEMGGDELLVDVVPIDLNRVVSATVETYRPLAEASGLALEFLPGAGLPFVQGQPNQLTQAVSSLLLNAIHYTPAGQIEVRTYLHALRSEVCLKVKDTGLGIGREDMAHIFDRYYRGKSASLQQVLGAGLGLAVAKEIVEAHDGWIDARSEENVGSVFTICLPVVLASEDTRERRILVVENSQLMRSVLQENLKQEGFVVSLAEHGRSALALLDDFKPDLILSDVAMPEMDGYAFLDAVRARPAWMDVPFIFITGQSDQKDYLQIQAARGVSFLLKPIVIEELMTAIRARLA